MPGACAPAAAPASPARLAGQRVGFDVHVHEADARRLALQRRRARRLRRRLRAFARATRGSEVRASISVRPAARLSGRVLAEATGALLTAGALEHAVGRIARLAVAPDPHERNPAMNPHAAVATPRPTRPCPAAAAARRVGRRGAASRCRPAVTRRYGAGDSAVDALRGVSLEVPAGQFTAVMGPSGSGKSTLMHLLAGLDRPTAGTSHIGGEDITAMSDKQLTKLRRRHIGFVFQSFNLLPTLTRRGERHAAARDRRSRGARPTSSTRCSRASASPTAATTSPPSSRAASSSASRSPAR